MVEVDVKWLYLTFSCSSMTLVTNTNPYILIQTPLKTNVNLNNIWHINYLQFQIPKLLVNCHNIKWRIISHDLERSNETSQNSMLELMPRGIMITTHCWENISWRATREFIDCYNHRYNQSLSTFNKPATPFIRQQPSILKAADLTKCSIKNPQSSQDFSTTT